MANKRHHDRWFHALTRAPTIRSLTSRSVSFTVAPDGGVTNVRLSNNSSDKLGRCLTSMISSWRFRSSPGGNYGFVFAKPD
jgi:hypothetical protein